MQNPFSTQPEFFVTSADLEHIMSGIYAGKTGRPSYPLLTLLGEVNRQLEAKRIIMTERRINVIDATPIARQTMA